MEKKAPCADEGVIHSGGRTKMSGQGRSIVRPVPVDSPTSPDYILEEH